MVDRKKQEVWGVHDGEDIPAHRRAGHVSQAFEQTSTTPNPNETVFELQALSWR